MIEGAYSMNEEEDSKGTAKGHVQQEGKIFVRKGFRPPVEPEVKRQKSTCAPLPPEGELKFDEERKMYYYGRSLSEVPPHERRVIQGDNLKEIVPMETKGQ